MFYMLHRFIEIKDKLFLTLMALSLELCQLVLLWLMILISEPCHSGGVFSCYAWQLLDNDDMHTFTKFNQNITCGPRIMSIFTNC